MSPNHKIVSSSHPTIFTSIQGSKLPARDKTEESIYMNAGMPIIAGIRNHRICSQRHAFPFLANPCIRRKLTTELASTFEEFGAGEDKIPP
jgi:hypothetical protein